METICTPKKYRKEKKQTGLQVPKNHHHRRKPPPPQAPPRDGLKLAALAIRLNVRLRLADMPISMQERALLISRSLFNTSTSSTDDPSSTSDHHHHRPSPTFIARSLKKEFDSLYGPAWHCVVGKSFGSFVTHSPGGFVYFSMDSLSFLLFKTEVHLVGA